MIQHFVVNFVLVKENKVLIEKSNASNWKLPGGHIEIEKDEDPLSACKREAEEELDCDIQIVASKSLIDKKYSYPRPMEMFIEKVDQDSKTTEPHDNIGMVYASISNQNPKGKEGQEIRWCSIEELMDLDVLKPIIIFAKEAIKLVDSDHSLY